MKLRGLYEVLYRFNLGSFVGAHSVQVERITDDETGEVYAEKVLDPEAVTIEQASALIGGEVSGVLAQCSALRAEIVTTEARADAADAIAAAALRETEELRQADAAKRTEIGRLLNAVEGARGLIIALQAENEALKAEIAALKPPAAPAPEAEA